MCIVEIPLCRFSPAVIHFFHVLICNILQNLTRMREREKEREKMLVFLQIYIFSFFWILIIWYVNHECKSFLKLDWKFAICKLSNNLLFGLSEVKRLSKKISLKYLNIDCFRFAFACFASGLFVLRALSECFQFQSILWTCIYFLHNLKSILKYMKKVDSCTVNQILQILIFRNLS